MDKCCSEKGVLLGIIASLPTVKAECHLRTGENSEVTNICSSTHLLSLHPLPDADHCLLESHTASHLHARKKKHIASRSHLHSDNVVSQTSSLSVLLMKELGVGDIKTLSMGSILVDIPVQTALPY